MLRLKFKRLIRLTTKYSFLLGGGGPRVQFGEDTDSSDDAFMEMGAYGGVNNIDTQARDFRIFGTPLEQCNTLMSQVDLSALVLFLVQVVCQLLNWK